ncbi:MAG: efflux RND transporter permease subunit [Bacteroidales bacterium]|nr:efflux RND transporter permease subunit [Bacteroidales bacterium]
MRRFAESIIKLKWLIIIVVVGLTAFFAYQARTLKIDADILGSLPDTDSVSILYKKMGTQFGGNDIGMVILESDNIFTKKVLSHIHQITDSIKLIDGVSTVTSLTNIIDIKNSEWGIEIGNLVDEYNLPDTKQKLDSLRSYVFSKEMYKGSIVSEDGTATLIMFTLLPDAHKEMVARDVKQKVQSIDLPEKLYFAGMPNMVNDLTDIIIGDMIWLIPIAFIVIILVLLLSFRSVKGVVLPLVVAGIAVIWTVGIISWLGYEFNLISSIIPVILLAIGSAYSIHVINRINQSIENDPKQVLIKAITYIALPVFLAALTTAVGFVSFIFGSYLTMIREFGMFTAIGVSISLLLSLTFVPAIIAVFSFNKKTPKINNERINKASHEKKSILTKYLLKPIVNLLIKHPKYTFAFWLVVIVLGIWGAFLIKTNSNITEYFKKDNPTRVSENIMQKKFGGSMPVFVSIKGDMQSPEVLKVMYETEVYMKKFKDITFAQSIADLVAEMNDVMGEGKKIPDERAKIEQLWFLLDGQDIMSQLVNEDLDEGIIQSKFASINSSATEEFEEYMNIFTKENSTENCKIEVTGLPHIYNRLNSNIIRSQATSLLLAVCLVLLIVGFMFKSFKKGLYATIPIIATIIFLFGFMGFTGIPLDIVTVLVGSIALGIGIDYSIHVITHFNYALKEKGDVNQAIEDTILGSGNAVIINVLSVSAGFLVLLFSQIVILQNFGLLVSISMISSGFGALTLLPAVLIFVNRKKKITSK